jgi:4-diphosphocytidyl-2-C-methyl-D-erythritol kinase
MVIKSYSKINLTLKINYKTRNRLHEIQSLYCWINLFDKIKINKINKKKDEIIFKGPFARLIKKKDNSVYKTLIKLRELNLISKYYSINVTKNIPVFSGLGGGTSNAAFILKYFLKNKINNVLLNKFTSLIGSDLKLFFKKQGYLKDLKTIINFKKKQKFYFLLVQPKIKCSTKEIYSNVKKTSKKTNLNKNLTESGYKFLEYLSKSRNDLQFIVEKKYPYIKKLLIDIKNENGCSFSRMTGSGSVCYGLFIDQIDAKKAINKLKDKYPKLWFSLAKTV